MSASNDHSRALEEVHDCIFKELKLPKCEGKTNAADYPCDGCNKTRFMDIEAVINAHGIDPLKRDLDSSKKASKVGRWTQAVINKRSREGVELRRVHPGFQPCITDSEKGNSLDWEWHTKAQSFRENIRKAWKDDPDKRCKPVKGDGVTPSTLCQVCRETARDSKFPLPDGMTWEKAIPAGEFYVPAKTLLDPSN
jgi:hypothetical protein